VCGIALRCVAAYQLGGALEPIVFMLGYANPRFASALYIMLIPLVAAVAVDDSTRPLLRWSAALVLVSLWLINIGLGTRGVWFAAALALPIAFIAFGPGKSRTLVYAIAGAALLGALGYWALAQLLHGAKVETQGLAALVPEGLQNSTLTRRGELWQQAIDAIRSQPLLGIGPMQLAAVPTDVGSHPHNWFLQVGAEWGLGAAVIVLFGLKRAGSIVRRIAQTQLRVSSGVVALTLSVTAALALALVDGNLVMPVSQSGFFLAFGALLGVGATCHQGDRRRMHTVARIAATAGAVCLGTAAVMFARADYDLQANRTAVFRASHPGAWMTPRLWEAGILN
jgi:O-antigen ligase